MSNKTGKVLYKFNSKLGISLVILMISIIVSIILISTAAITITNVVDDSKITTFSKNLTSIQDVVESYYTNNNAMPILNDSKEMNKDELLSISRFQNILTEELIKNNDLNSKFYKIDLAKINVTKTEYGNGKLGESDMFVVAYPSMNVYYPYGLEVKDTTYFSLTSKITNVINIDQNETNNTVSNLSSADGIILTQAYGFVNQMDVNIKVNMSVDEQLYMSVSGDTNRLITTSIGENIFKFNSLSSIVEDSETIKVPALTISEANYIESGTKPISERYVDILKYKDSKIIDKVRIDLSHYNKKPPTIKEATIASLPKVNEVHLSLDSSTNSSIKEVRYEYLTKYVDNGTIENYYTNISDFDDVYMKDIGKKAKLEGDLATTITAPKNVQSIKVAVIDKANNISLYTQEIAPRIYIGYSVDSNTKESLQLTAKVFSANGVKSISFSKSIDGINFTDEQIYTIDNTINGTTLKQCIPYTNISENTAYVKIVAVNYDGTLTENRVITVDLKNVITPPTIEQVTKSTWDNPKIPLGFSKSTVVGETAVSTGLVIIDNVNKNEFVWIPVKDLSKFVRMEYNKGKTVLSCTEESWDGISTVTELDKIYKSVKDNGGFYIARYEAGIDTITTPTTKDHKTVQNGSIKPVSKAGRGTWNYVIWGTVNSLANPGYGAVTIARSMYDTTDIKSNLVYGVQWDAALEFIKSTNSTYVIDSIGKGNYTSKLGLTGSNSSYKINNIYDMAGNVYELTMESYSKNFIARGGAYGINGSTYPASYRDNNSISYKNVKLGFRCAIYLK